jgi:hypothetical protein
MNTTDSSRQIDYDFLGVFTIHLLTEVAEGGVVLRLDAAGFD